MTSNRPYLIRALFEWILDNDMTPHLLVDAMHPNADVPRKFVEEGRIVLNIAPTAVKDLMISNEMITFSARFGGVPSVVGLPPAAVLGIYARENGHGMIFPQEEDLESHPTSEDGESTDLGAQGQENAKGERKTNRPALRIVK
ncbi:MULTISPECIES: ClpXP protease specificity-enhancing factor [Thiorhodovibrio]|uniref:ClpXP protease specificity-enhancing factor n=1 Tax=Thiorhodovibrio TaxID=61593 RepID=UPI001912E033|nr:MULTISPECIES: ClpXP protease specificity-enhancing factor [Thiorhodovibrio]MBK5970861.1 ClpXP protease specificity-enhancing factor [Thiorhodovibrio winogradskyi]WPL10747.1 Stringent starvation protein B [Thiorhodovibrio litoralis]